MMGQQVNMPIADQNVQSRFTEVWPALPQAAWSDACATLQLWMQIVGKVRLALMPPINHCWGMTLLPTARGLTTLPMPHGVRTLQIDFDFLDHVLVVETDEGARRVIALRPMTCGGVLWRGDGGAGGCGVAGCDLAGAGGSGCADPVQRG